MNVDVLMDQFTNYEIGVQQRITDKDIESGNANGLQRWLQSRNNMFCEEGGDEH